MRYRVRFGTALAGLILTNALYVLSWIPMSCAANDYRWGLHLFRGAVVFIDSSKCQDPYEREWSCHYQTVARDEADGGGRHTINSGWLGDCGVNSVGIRFIAVPIYIGSVCMLFGTIWAGFLFLEEMVVVRGVTKRS